MSLSPQFIASLVTLLVIANAMLGACSYLIFIERKIAAWVQNRIGPNRVKLLFITGKIGLGQAIADGLKLFVKEEYTPPGVDRRLFIIAPVLAIVPAMIGWAVIPWGGYLDWNGTLLNITAAPLNIGVIYILAIGSLAVYAVVVGGFGSNNKYSFLGGLRATAQMLSYEIPMSLCVLITILMTGSARADWIVNTQANSLWSLPGLAMSGGVWFICYQPLLAIIFFACILAECNRAPFDLAEAEQELVGGYHTEYSSMKWALFFLGEYMHMITGSAFFTLLFLGGWDWFPVHHLFNMHIPELPMAGGLGLVLLKTGIYAGKVLALLVLMMWIRWTLPRFRFDQLMRLAWRALIPISLVMLLVTGVLVFLRADPRWFLAANVVVLLGAAILGPLIPQGPPVNRRVALEGSRFSPPKPA